MESRISTDVYIVGISAYYYLNEIFTMDDDLDIDLDLIISIIKSDISTYSIHPANTVVPNFDYHNLTETELIEKTLKYLSFMKYTCPIKVNGLDHFMTILRRKKRRISLEERGLRIKW